MLLSCGLFGQIYYNPTERVLGNEMPSFFRYYCCSVCLANSQYVDDIWTAYQIPTAQQFSALSNCAFQVIIRHCATFLTVKHQRVVL